MTIQQDPLAERSADCPRLLIVDDNDSLARLLAEYLRRNGFAVTLADDAIGMKRALAAEPIDLVVLDLMLPGENGLTILRDLREQANAPPVLMFSAFSTDRDRINGLELGAEDFIQKPCSPGELLARIRVALRRAERASLSQMGAGPRRRVFRFGGWTLDATMRVLLDPAGIIVHLSEGEFNMLLTFVERPQRLLTRGDLLDDAFGVDRDIFDRNIDVQISRLRRKMSGRVGSLDLIRTVRGQGYAFDLPVVLGHDA